MVGAHGRGAAYITEVKKEMKETEEASGHNSHNISF
jgi:hypothetical protein